MTIHASDPFATPDEERSGLRRLRGRLPAPVALWTAYANDGRPAGLTVSSTLVVDGDPGRLLGILDDESQVWTAIAETGTFAVMTLRDADSRLADVFAGLMPAPGGGFAQGDWTRTGFGPVLAGAAAWAGCRLDASERFGWGLLVRATVIEAVVTDDAAAPLIHYRGRYLP